MTPFVGVRIQVHKKGWWRHKEGTFKTFGGISGALRLGLRQEKCSDLHLESHLVQHLYLMEAPPVRLQVENLRVQNWEGLVLSYDLMMRYQVEMEMASLRDIHWERSYLVHNVELR